MMSRILLAVFLFVAANAVAQQQSDTTFAKNWTVEEKKAANTAADSSWMSKDEQLVVFYLNLARLYPKKFAETYLLDFKHAASKDELSGHSEDLYEQLDTSVALKPVMPDKRMYQFARCFSKELVDDNRFDHVRKRCKNGWFSECCAAGYPTPMATVIGLLIDEGVATNAHRDIMLSSDTRIGVSLRTDHPTWHGLAVLDFY